MTIWLIILILAFLHVAWTFHGVVKTNRELIAQLEAQNKLTERLLALEERR